MISLVASQAKEPFFQNRIATVPQCEGETDLLMTVGDARNSIFVPTVGARPRMIVREVIPGTAIRTVVFAHRAPSAFAQIWSPTLPVLRPSPGLFQSLLFRSHRITPHLAC